MRMTYAQWDLWTRGSAIRRAGYAGFKRNVAVAMGNWLAAVDEPAEDAVAVLREAIEDEELLVRQHAAWALGRRRSPTNDRPCSAEAPPGPTRFRPMREGE
jgi:epoxyqueuosine reductase